MDCSLSDIDEPLYRVWLHSPSVFGTRTETILAFKIAKEVQGVPSRVLKALRGLQGVDPELRLRVEQFVENDDSLTFVFVEGGTLRSIALVGPPD